MALEVESETPDSIDTSQRLCVKPCGGSARSSAEALHEALHEALRTEALREVLRRLCGGSARSPARSSVSLALIVYLEMWPVHAIKEHQHPRVA